MTWLRVLGLRLAVACALVATALSAHAMAPRPSLPFALLDSIHRTFTQVFDKAERQVADLETTRPARPVRPDVAAILHELQRRIAAADDAARIALDVELAVAGSLTPERRQAALGCIEHHLRQARCGLAHASDPQERAEYAATCERLRELRLRLRLA